MGHHSRDKSEDWPKEPAPPDQDGSKRLFVAATLMARRGRYEEATRLLQQAYKIGGCSKAEAFDFQARICAQQGLYLDAERCWREAQAHDEGNPAYADALDRLRRTRQPTWGIYRLVAFLGSVAVLSLLVWYTWHSSQQVGRNQDTHDRRFAEIISAIGTLRNEATDHERELANALKEIRENLKALDVKLTQRVSDLPTTLAMTENRSAVLDRLDQNTASIEQAMKQSISDIHKCANDADAALLKRVVSVETTVSHIQQALSKMEALIAKRLDEVEVGVRGDIQPRATSEEVRALGNMISSLEEQFAKLVILIRDHRQLRKADGLVDREVPAGAGHATSFSKDNSTHG